MERYLEIVILLNFAVNFLLLLGTVRILGLMPKYKRIAAASIFGGIYSGLCFIKELKVIGSFPGRILSLLVICMIAFGMKRSAVKKGGVFLLLALALEGAARSVPNVKGFELLLCSGAISLLCRFLWTSGTVGKHYADIKIHHMGKTVALTALRDTGNSLVDPVSGEHILVIGPEAAYTLTGLTRKELASPIETINKHPVPGLRVIPYSSVGNSCGLMLAMRFKETTVDGKAGSIIAAMAADGMGEYEALIGGSDDV